MKLTVVGSGHVGLVAGLCFAEIGHDVICLDSIEEKVNGLAEGRLPFYEPELQGLLKRNREQGRIRFTTDLPTAVQHGEVLFLAVGTPPLPGGGADLSAIERVCREIAAHADGDKLVVEKSTVPVGTGERIEQTLGDSGRKGARFDVASNPEFLSEGRAVVDFLVPDRIVIGVENDRSEHALRSVYKPIVDGSFEWNLETPAPAPRCDVPLLVTNRNSAELIKHASNSFLATKISYINAVAELCERIGADIEKVAEGMGYDRRIGKDFLRAGIGFGGFCFPKDLQAFVHIADQQGCDFRLLREVENINLRRVDLFIDKCRDRLWVLKDKKDRRLGACHSRPTPMTCAIRPPSRWSGACWPQARASRPMTRKPWTKRDRCCLRSISAARQSTPPRVRKPCCCSPIGPSSPKPIGRS